MKLDKSDIFSIPKLQKPAVRRSSSLLKQVLSKEKTTINALGQYHIYKTTSGPLSFYRNELK